MQRLPRRIWAAVPLVAALVACDGPGGPGGAPAAITVTLGEITAAVAECCEAGPYRYRASVTLRESAGVGATIAEVAITIADEAAGASTTQLPGAGAFGTARLAPRATLAAVVAADGPLTRSRTLSVRVTFRDDGDRVGTTEAAAGVALDLTGTWTGAMPAVKTEPVADWSEGRLSLRQNGDTLTGGLISRDGVQFPVAGSVSAEWAPVVTIGGLPGTSTCAGVSLLLTEFEFSGGQVRGLSGRAVGRCFGTVAGAFTLRRLL